MQRKLRNDFPWVLHCDAIPGGGYIVWRRAARSQRKDIATFDTLADLLTFLRIDVPDGLPDAQHDGRPRVISHDDLPSKLDDKGQAVVDSITQGRDNH